MDLQQDQLDILKSFGTNTVQGPIGYSLSSAYAQFGLKAEEVPNITKMGKVDRSDVFKMVKDSKFSTIECLVAIMAWGGQNRKHGRSFFDARAKWLPLMDSLRWKPWERKSVYDKLKSADTPGVGPAYFTKIMFFFDATQKSYIMDQWTSKSMHLLTGQKSVPKMMGDNVSGSCPSSHYEEFCVFVEDLAKELKVEPHKAEMILFSEGKGRGGWRSHVKTNWSKVSARPVQKKSPVSFTDWKKKAKEEANLDDVWADVVKNDAVIRTGFAKSKNKAEFVDGFKDSVGDSMSKGLSKEKAIQAFIKNDMELYEIFKMSNLAGQIKNLIL